VATVTCAKHGNPLDEDAPEHEFAANPLAYTTHQDRLPKAKEAAAVAYGLRAIRETYKTTQRQLSVRELYISRKKYYNLARLLSNLPSGNKGQPRALGALKLLLY
jgi:hypothetical protein